MAQIPYDDLIMDHIKNARNYRVLDDANRRCHGSNPLCGDEVDVYLKVGRDGRIEEAAFQCSCCGISMASASMMTENVKGLGVAEARNRARAVIAFINARIDSNEPAADEMQRVLVATVQEFPARKQCAALPWITLEAALAERPEAVFMP
jgi:nitrogen fixation protein NifU and related proteins